MYLIHLDFILSKNIIFHNDSTYFNYPPSINKQLPLKFADLLNISVKLDNSNRFDKYEEKTIKHHSKEMSVRN